MLAYLGWILVLCVIALIWLGVYSWFTFAYPWRLMYYLFRRHSIEFLFGSDSHVAPVCKAPNGLRYVKCYGDILYLKEGGKLSDGRSYTPLTWTPPTTEEE